MGEVVLADGDGARNDHYLCDVLVKDRWGSWTTETDDGVLDFYYNGVGLSFEVRREDRRMSDLQNRWRRGRNAGNKANYPGTRWGTVLVCIFYDLRDSQGFRY